MSASQTLSLDELRISRLEVIELGLGNSERGRWARRQRMRDVVAGEMEGWVRDECCRARSTGLERKKGYQCLINPRLARRVNVDLQERKS